MLAAGEGRPSRKATTAARGFLRSKSRDYGRTIVGRRVRVLWEDNCEWFDGVIKDYDVVTELHMVRYDDGDQREEPLNFEGAVQWKMLPARSGNAGTVSCRARRV